MNETSFVVAKAFMALKGKEFLEDTLTYALIYLNIYTFKYIHNHLYKMLRTIIPTYILP